MAGTQNLKKIKFIPAIFIVAFMVMAVFFIRGMDAGGIRWDLKTKTYKIQSRVETRYHLGQDRLPLIPVTITGILTLKVFEKNDQRIHAGVKFSQLDATVNGESSDETARMYGGEFLVELTPTGEMVQFHFSNAISDEKKEILTSFIKQFEMVVSGDGQVSDIHQTDATGRYLAAYDYRDPASMKKKKTRYLEIISSENRNFDELTADILLSDVRFDIQHTDCWLASLSGKETLVLTMGNGHRLAEIRQRFDIHPLPEASGREAALWKDKSYEQVVRALANEKKPVPVLKEEDSFQDSEYPDSDNFSKEERLDILCEQLATLTNKGPVSDSDRFKKFLTANPDLVEEIPELIKNGDMASKHAILIGMLGLINTTEAQNALSEILEAPYQSNDNRVRAAIAFGSITARPTEDTINTLAGMMDTINEGSEDNDIAGAALFSLGIISSNMDGGDIDVTATINDRLSFLLDRAQNDEQTYYALGALGNTAEPGLAAEVLPYLESENSDLRRVAAEALRDMDSLDVQDTLFQALPVETEPAVRAQEVESLTQMQLPQSRIDTLASMALTETDADVRRCFIEFIDKNRENISDIKNLIDGLLENETSKNNIKALLRIETVR